MREQLKSLDGQLVTVVRPFFGSQSDSFMGEFEVVELMGIYQLILNDHSMIFKLGDVESVVRTVIRLKGPSSTHTLDIN